MQKFTTVQTHTNYGQTVLLLQHKMNGIDQDSCPETTICTLGQMGSIKPHKMNWFDQDSCLPTSQIFHKDIFNNKLFYDFMVTIHGRTNWH